MIKQLIIFILLTTMIGCSTTREHFETHEPAFDYDDYVNHYQHVNTGDHYSEIFKRFGKPSRFYRTSFADGQAVAVAEWVGAIWCDGSYSDRCRLYVDPRNGKIIKAQNFRWEFDEMLHMN